MAPLIGISLSLDARGRFRRGRRYHYLDERYAEAVARAGGIPTYLPIQPRCEEIAARIDGLLTPGGDDILPETPYPEEVRFEAAPPEQIAFDRALLSHALARGLPILGICYGMQILALHCGGALHHHVPLDVPGAVDHGLPEGEARHPIRVEPGTLLEATLGARPEPVNSAHHQAVASPGEGLRASARAADGVIEAIEREGGDFCLGVQWHPERNSCTHGARLFGAFVSRCRSFSRPPELLTSRPAGHSTRW
jgi:putative glutamine amidotransferase